MNGRAYVFLRRDGAQLPPGYSGHVGWGIEIGPGSFFAGATENPRGAPYVAPGADNGAWTKSFTSEADMYKSFAGLKYDQAKWLVVRDANPAAARGAALQTILAGYTGIGNNCLDHTYRVLHAYGEKGLPFMQTHPAPNDWFAALNGELKNLQKPDV